MMPSPEYAVAKVHREAVVVSFCAEGRPRVGKTRRARPCRNRTSKAHPGLAAHGGGVPTRLALSWPSRTHVRYGAVAIRKNELRITLADFKLAMRVFRRAKHPPQALLAFDSGILILVRQEAPATAQVLKKAERAETVAMKVIAHELTCENMEAVAS